MAFAEKWPYISWNVKNIRGLRRSCSGDFFVKGYRFYLTLEKKIHANAKDDCLEMELVDTELEPMNSYSFMVSVYLKDVHGENHFVQKSHIVCTELSPIKLIWRITLFDLFENNSLNWKTSLNFVCMFGPESKYQRADGESTCESITACSCKKHLEKLSLDLSRLLAHGTNGDVNLRCEGKTFSVHKNILSARCPTFKKMFQNESFDEEFPTEVSISNIGISSLGPLLVFLYNGKVLLHNQTVDNVMQLYDAAVKYQVSGLVEECRKFLVQNLEENSACRFLLFAHEKDDKAFKDHISSFILKKEILNTECWIEFACEHPGPAIQMYYFYLEKYLIRRSFLTSIHKVS